MIKPIETIDFSWAFVLRKLSRERSRLFIRARTSYTPRWALPFVELAIGPADFVNAGAMLRGIKKRVETSSRRGAERGRRSAEPLTLVVCDSAWARAGHL